MSNKDELDAIRQARGTCPICAEEGKTLRRQMHGLASHLMKEHTVDQLVYQIAGEAVLDALEVEEQPKFATGGLVKGPEGHEPTIIDRGCDYVIDEAHLFTKDRPFPEQGHIVNTPKFQAALEEFRQDYEQGRLEELHSHHSMNT